MSSSQESSNDHGTDPSDPFNELAQIEEVLDQIDSETRNKDDDARVSIYLAIFEGMINIVYEHEEHLLSGEEWDLMSKFGNLSYNARFVLVRLALRKVGRWYSIPKLENLKKEVGTGLPGAIDELCEAATKFEQPAPIPPKASPPPHEIIDLTMDSDDDEPGPSSEPPPSQPVAASPNYSYFCQGEDVMTITELLECLTVDQLKSVAKDMKVRPGKQTKSEIIVSLIKHASKQTALPFGPSPCKGKAKVQDTLHFPVVSGTSKTKVPKPLQQAKLSFKPLEKPALNSQEHVLRSLALKHLVKCVRLNPDIYELFMRLNVIAFRSTELPTSIALPALLTAFRKRSYTRYPYQRSDRIWSTREDFLRYYDALKLQARVSSLLDAQIPLSTPAATPSPKKQPSSKAQSAPPSTQPPPSKDDDDDSDYEEPTPVESERIQRARLCKQIFDEEIYPVWEVCVTVHHALNSTVSESLEEEVPDRAGLERFQQGYLYTRMVSRATECLGQLKEYKREYAVIEALLKQRIWLRGKRAKWYERRAILTARYMPHIIEDFVLEKVLADAVRGVIEALKDEDTALVYRPSLFRRLEKLEKRLKIPEEERSRCDGQLKKPEVVEITAIRVWKRGEGKLSFDANGRLIPTVDKSTEKENSVTPSTPLKKIQMTLHSTPVDSTPVASEEKTGPQVRWTGKSVWVGKGEEEVNVETRALQYYERKGFKGMHAETSILTTLFALLFWDVIFSDVPGAFETPYQTEPLDLREDVFYHARKHAVDVRLKEIRAGWAKQIIEKSDKKYREQKTWCVGMSWDLCDVATLVEIAECLGGEALAKICTLFCEDYNGRSSGVPDLILWNPETKACKFVEVKGPGDTERENQKLWMDSLINAGVDVEVCRVYEPNKRPVPKSKGKGKRTPKSVPPKKGRGKHASTPSNLEATTMDDGVSPVVHDLVNNDVGWDDDDDDDQLPVPIPGTKATQAMVNPSLKRPFDGSETVTPSNRKKRKVSFP